MPTDSFGFETAGSRRVDAAEYYFWMTPVLAVSNSDSGGDVVTGVNARLVSAHLFLDDAPRESQRIFLQLATFSCLGSPRFHGARVRRGFFRALSRLRRSTPRGERPKWPSPFFLS